MKTNFKGVISVWVGFKIFEWLIGKALATELMFMRSLSEDVVITTLYWQFYDANYFKMQIDEIYKGLLLETIGFDGF